MNTADTIAIFTARSTEHGVIQSERETDYRTTVTCERPLTYATKFASLVTVRQKHRIRYRLPPPVPRIPA